MATGKERIAEVVDYSLLHGDEETINAFNIDKATLDRYKRGYRQHFGENADLLIKIKNRYSANELKIIAEGKTASDKISKDISFVGDEVIFGAMGDSHIGSRYTDERFVVSALEEFDKRGCQFFTHGGDVTEGMSGRDGHVYELTHIGYKAQKEAAISLFKDWKKPSYFISGNHDCHSSDTECLTRRGWVTYDKIRKDDFVLSYDKDNDICRWMPITDIIIKDYAGDMLNFDFKVFQHFVTPNHRMLYAPYHNSERKTDNSEYRYCLAKELIDTPPTRVMSFKVSAFSSKDDYPISDNMLEVIGWILTDGAIGRKISSHTGSYNIYQSKDISEIVRALEGAGLQYHHGVRQRNITQICGKILKKPSLPAHNFHLYADSAIKVKAYLETKSIPSWMYELSDRQFDILAKVFMQANGSTSNPRKKKQAAHTFGLHGRYEFLNEVQILFSMHGYSTQLRQDVRGAWVLDVCKRQNTVVEIHNGMYVEHYEGVVWCISTPLTNFMIRRNGRPSFTGNCWYMKKADIGADIVEDICSELPNAIYLGMHEGDINVNGAKVRLWHGEDSSSYSTSYRLQKIVESFSGGEKPSALLCSHTHKAGYFFERNVQIVTVGAIQKQSAWMRYKRLAAHTGFYIIKMGIRNGSIVWFEPRWYPFYE